MTEVRVTSPTGGAKGTKPARFDLIPSEVLWLLAEHYGKGSAKYPPNDNGIDNWRNGYDWSKSYAALQRHLNLFWSGEEYDDHEDDCDPDCNEHTESLHLVCAMWHCITMSYWSLIPQLKDMYDDRQDPKTLRLLDAA